MSNLKLISNTRVIAWLFLLAAIFFEVLGTSFMTSAARNGGNIGYIIMGAALAASYYFLALSIRSIGVGIAYAIWEGLGVTLLTLVGYFVFLENISIQEFIGLGIAIIGIVCVALGEEH